jgi:DNA-binding Lrp family transcriptional regulator
MDADKVSLSGTEKRILLEICRKGLLGPERETAKRLRISPSTLNYKIRKFERERIITGYRYRVDYLRTGLRNLSWVFLSLKTAQRDIRGIMERLLTVPEIKRVSYITGDYDLALKIYSKDNADFFSTIGGIETMLADSLQDISAMNVTKRYVYHELPVDLSSPEIKTDKKDFRIMEVLSENPCTSLEVLAKKAGMHRNTLYRRWKRLVGSGAVLKKSARINPDYYSDIDCAFRVFVLINSVKGKADELAGLLIKKTDIHELDKTLFPYDLMMLVWCRSTRDFYGFQERLFRNRKISRLINRLRSYVVLEEKSSGLRGGAHFPYAEKGVAKGE